MTSGLETDQAYSYSPRAHTTHSLIEGQSSCDSCNHGLHHQCTTTVSSLSVDSQSQHTNTPISTYKQYWMTDNSSHIHEHHTVTMSHTATINDIS